MRTRLATAGLAAAALLAAGCGETEPASSAADDTSSTPVTRAGSWEQIPKAPVDSRKPEGAFWINDRFVVVAGATVAAWNPQGDGWEVLVEIPQADQCEGCGYGETAVWTGERILLWGGGFSYRASDGSTHSGVAVDLEGTITPLADAPIERRGWHTTVWTGAEMIIWGGICGRHECRDGAAYDPRSGSWRRIAQVPTVGYAHTVVWTGDEMIVWGGSDDYESEGMKGCVTRFIGEGAAYDPVADSWRLLPDSPLEPRGWHSAVWTGEEMVVWGGATGLGCDYQYPSDGAAYDPSADSWRAIASSPLSGRVEAGAVWTGEEMLVWGGSTHGRSITLDDGAAFELSSSEWRMLPETPMKSRAMHASVWSGNEMIVWGGCCNDNPERISSFGDGAVFRPEER